MDNTKFSDIKNSLASLRQLAKAWKRLEAALGGCAFVRIKYHSEDQKIRDLGNEMVNSLTSDSHVQTTSTGMHQEKLSRIDDSFKRLHQLTKAWSEGTHNN